EAAQARTQQTQDFLDKQALQMRPETQDVATALAKRNAFAEYMKSRGLHMGQIEAEASPAAAEKARITAEAPYRAQESDVGIRALDSASQRRIAEVGAAYAAKPLSMAEQRNLQGIHDQAQLATQVLPLVRKLADAQDQFNNTIYGKIPTMLTGVPGIAGLAQS